MKKAIFLFFLIFPILLVSQRRPKIKGNRSVTEVKEQLPPFNAIELANDFDIELKKSFEEGYEIVADDNLVDVLKFEVADSTLVISSFYDITSKKKLEIAVNFKELTAITVKAGKIFSDDMIASDALHLNTFGNAELDIDASGFLTSISAMDNSSIDLNLDVDSLSVSMKHKTDGDIYAITGAKTVALADNASLTIEGSTENFQVEMAGNTKLKADRLEAAGINLSVQESSFARVNAFGTFVLKSSGASKTHLYGNPKISIDKFTDTSQLLKKSD